MRDSVVKNSAIANSYPEEIAQKLSTICSNEQIIWAPIRHHSPHCSQRLLQLIEEHKPDVILIEGPEEANHLIPFLIDENTQAPVAVYLYGLATQRHRCFIPFADMSPEWVALQAGAKQNIDTEFIDLPLSDRLEVSEIEKDWKHRGELFNSDFLFEESEFIKTLVEQSDCRDFDEWWDRNFEIERSESADDFFLNLMAYCLMLRTASKGQSEKDAVETLQRECHMAMKIQAHLSQGKRCLIVCGGYHCQGIYEQLIKPIEFSVQRDIDVKERGVYLIPYSLDRLNQASGYSAGMPDVGYYQAQWEVCGSLKKQRSKDDLHVELLIKLMEIYRENSIVVSMPDVIEAGVMMKRLANLRIGQGWQSRISRCNY